MKKAIVLLAVGFAFTYCNPSQQADQTTLDSGRMADSSSMMSADSTMMPADTTNRPDSLQR